MSMDFGEMINLIYKLFEEYGEIYRYNVRNIMWIGFKIFKNVIGKEQILELIME